MWIQVRSNVQVQVRSGSVKLSFVQRSDEIRSIKSIPLQGLSLSFPVIDVLQNHLRCRLGRILPSNALDEIIIGICTISSLHLARAKKERNPPIR